MHLLAYPAAPSFAGEGLVVSLVATGQERRPNEALLSQAALVDPKAGQGGRIAGGTSVSPAGGSGTAARRRLDGEPGPLGGTSSTGQPHPGPGAHARCVGLAPPRASCLRRRPRPAPGPPQSRVLGAGNRNPGAGHRRDDRHVQRLRLGVDSPAALPRRGPPGHDLERHGQVRRHEQAPRDARRVDRVAAAQ